MGKKYASIHIFVEKPEEQEKVLSVVKKHYKNDEIQEMLMSMVRWLFALGPRALVVQTRSAMSIYDEREGFQSIEETAKKFSSLVDYPVVYTSNFDEDVFVYGVLRLGTVITSGKVGDEFYDIEPESMDIHKFCKELKIEKTDSMKRINTSEYIDEIESEIESCLKVELFMRPYFFEPDDPVYGRKNYKLKAKQNGVHIYQKLN